MSFAFRNQPWRAIYWTTNIILFLLIKLPAYTILYVFPQARPRRSWSLGRSLIVFASRSFIDVMYSTSVSVMAPTPLEKIAKEADSGFVWVEAAPEFVSGEVKEAAATNNVSPARTSGFWYGKWGPDGNAGQKASINEKVIYHFHGGGFVMGTGHPSNGPMKTCLEGLMQYIPGEPRVFALEYRISSAVPFSTANPFPAALLDAIAGYWYLVQDLGFLPSNIIISGDSAGGLLAFWLARYLAISKFPELPNGGGLLLLSPTVDWANTQMGPSSSMKTNGSSDFVYTILASGYTCRALLGNIPESEASNNPWIAPGSIELQHTPGLFAGLPKTCIVAGGAEQTLDAMITLKNRLVEDLGSNNVTYLEFPDATHDFLLASWHEPERTDTLKELAKWAGGEIWPANQVIDD